jgi:hypothetical protein
MVTVEEQEEREKGLEGSTTTPVRAAAAAVVKFLQAEDLILLKPAFIFPKEILHIFTTADSHYTSLSPQV